MPVSSAGSFLAPVRTTTAPNTSGRSRLTLSITVRPLASTRERTLSGSSVAADAVAGADVGGVSAATRRSARSDASTRRS